MKIAVAYLEKSIALKNAACRYSVVRKNTENLAADFIIGWSVKHRLTIGFVRRGSYGRTATVDKIVRSNLGFPLVIQADLPGTGLHACPLG